MRRGFEKGDTAINEELSKPRWFRCEGHRNCTIILAKKHDRNFERLIGKTRKDGVRIGRGLELNVRCNGLGGCVCSREEARGAEKGAERRELHGKGREQKSRG